MLAETGRLALTLRTMGFDATVELEIDGDIGIRFSNQEELGRFVSEALRLLSGDELVRLGTGRLVTLNQRAATLICDRAQ